jgi:AcrR family transcriptional regulator
VNIALVNYHFGDKLGLYTEVLKSATMGSKVTMLDKVNDPTADPVDLLRDLIRVAMRNMSTTAHAFDILMQQERLKPTPAIAFLIEETIRPRYVAMCILIGRILHLPAEHPRCRLATHSIIGQIKHFGEPERLMSQLDPAMLASKTPEEIADFITNFSLGYLQSDVQRSTPPRAARKRTSTRKQKLKVHSRP